MEELIMLSAACATSGSVAHFHAVSITPEALTREAAFGPKKPSLSAEFGRKEQKETEELIYTATTSNVDLVILGCPHYSITQIGEIARLVAGRKLKREIWIQAAEIVKSYARRMGYLSVIEDAGGRVLGEGCQDLMPPGFFNTHGYRAVASDSAKLAFYIKGLQNVLTHFGTVSRCVDAAVSGTWR
jgi:predicted aconitase